MTERLSNISTFPRTQVSQVLYFSYIVSKKTENLKSVVLISDLKQFIEINSACTLKNCI